MRSWRKLASPERIGWPKRESTVWLEITNLIIPGANDDPSETDHWLAGWSTRMGASEILGFFVVDDKLRS